MSKQNIYDNDLFYENFEKIRSKEINFNDIIETPIILGMIPELYKKKVLDIGCGMGQHALQYSKKGALSVLGIDISEKMLAYARKNNAASNIEYRRLAFEELDDLEEKFDVITSSLAFDYVENFERLMKQIYSHLNENGKCVFSMSHPISTAYDGTFDRYTRTETGERLYANLRNYGIEGKRVKDGVDLVCHLPSVACVIHSEKNRLTQVLSNFLSNACKYTSEGSITMGYERIGAILRFYVADTGKGLAEENIPHVFERFAKFDSFVQGTGLGLSICESIIQSLDGKIGVDSELGKGSTFWFTIPYNPVNE